MAKRRREPSSKVIKLLFGSSPKCQFFEHHGCEIDMVEIPSLAVRGEICHIRGWSEGSARYDPSMTDAQRNSFENLILMCPNHHTEVDHIRPDYFTVQRLEDMKHRATWRPMGTMLSDRQLDAVADRAIARWVALNPSADVDGGSFDDEPEAGNPSPGSAEYDVDSEAARDRPEAGSVPSSASRWATGGSATGTFRLGGGVGSTAAVRGADVRDEFSADSSQLADDPPSEEPGTEAQQIEPPTIESTTEVYPPTVQAEKRITIGTATETDTAAPVVGQDPASIEPQPWQGSSGEVRVSGVSGEFSGTPPQQLVTGSLEATDSGDVVEAHGYTIPRLPPPDEH